MHVRTRYATQSKRKDLPLVLVANDHCRLFALINILTLVLTSATYFRTKGLLL